jgi:hypothetical protein
MTEDDLDPRWEWCDVRSLGDPGPVWIKVRCLHTQTVPVITMADEHVAELCLVCDSPLPPVHHETR